MIGVSGASAPFHVEVGKTPDHVPVTTLHQNMVEQIALVMLPKQDLVTKTLVQVSEVYSYFNVDAKRFKNAEFSRVSVTYFLSLCKYLIKK